MYLTAVIDWYSRYVLSWRLSNKLEGRFCLEALEEALTLGEAGDLQHRSGLAVHITGVYRSPGGGRDRGEPGRSRACELDNVFVERLWRSVKYEDIYIKDYCSSERAGVWPDRLLPVLR